MAQDCDGEGTAITYLHRAIKRLEDDDIEHAHVEIGYATLWIPE